MGKLKSINVKLQFFIIALLMIIITIPNIPAFRENSLVLSLVLLLVGIGATFLITHFVTRPLHSVERDLENRINERTEALNAATEKLGKATDELRHTQKQVIQTETQKSLTSIVSGFAHEINNPLTGILGYIDLMELNDSLSDYSKKRLEGIKDQAIRIKDIVDELNWLDPEMEQVKGEIDLVNQLEKMIKIIGKEPKAAGIAFEKDFLSEEAIVCGNHFALWQVFEGIIENAIEAITERNVPKGKACILVRLNKNHDDQVVVIDIIDNGGGFQNLEKVFNPFYTTKPRTEKRGIGLSIAYNVVQEHKGNISVQNSEHGAMVSVHLPFCEMGCVNKHMNENKNRYDCSS
jgi:C4-dicarboxylate-specific signal transduction histidine kinase